MRYQEPPQLPLTDAIVRRFTDILETGIYTNGKYVREFEELYKSTFNLRGECIAVNGCQSGLMLCLIALDVNRCLVPDFTFSATANAAYWSCRNGLVTGDCNLKTFNLKARLPNDVDGVLATHIFGNPCDCDKLKEMTSPESIPLIYDAAHAHGASFDGTPIGDCGDASVFSLSPTKQVTGGEGGMIVTNDKELADRLRVLRNYGTEKDYHQSMVGLNARMSEFHAIIGLESLSRFWVHHRHRLSIVEKYMRHIPIMLTQRTNPNAVHAWKDFSVLLPKKREKAIEAFEKEGIETKTYFRPISDLRSFTNLTRHKHSYQLFESILQLPLHANMTDSDVEKVLSILDKVIE